MTNVSKNIAALLCALLGTLLGASAFTAIVGCAPAPSSHSSALAAQDQLEETTHEMPPNRSAETLQAEVDVMQSSFVEPTITPELQSHLESTYAYVDPAKSIRADLRLQALAFYDANKARITNSSYLTLVDFAKASSQARMHIVNMSTGVVWAVQVAHGRGSDLGNSGYAKKFSNVPGSEASSLGFYKTAETYSGNHGLSLRLDGLSATNSNVRARDVVLHGADYVLDNSQRAGRSWGCFAVSMANRDRVVNILKGGSLIYAKD